MRYLDNHAVRELEKRAKRVHCLLGFPLDVVTMDDVLAEIAEATRTRHRLFISTVNLNFVTQAQTDEDFRNSLRSSNLCVVDGVAVKLIGRFLGIPIPECVAGSDILGAIWDKPSNSQTPPLKVFFFGGTEEAGQLACDAINRHPSENIVCVGSLYPGYGSIEDMSIAAVLEKINRTKPDFLIVALGAKKGQAWIMQNQDKLEVPVISHLGATINFLAGTLKRAPVFWQRTGLEWLWRIKEEPALARRYWLDFRLTLQLAATKILPLAIHLRYNAWRWGEQELSFSIIESGKGSRKQILRMQVAGSHLESFNHPLNWASFTRKNIAVSLDDLNWIGTQSMGRLLLLSEFTKKNGNRLELVGQSQSVMQEISLSGLNDFLTSA